MSQTHPLPLLPIAHINPANSREELEHAANTPLPASASSSVVDVVVRNSPSLKTGAVAYGLATAATGVKTFAWWVNQYPAIAKLNFGAQWATSVGVASAEYLPMTAAMALASKNGLHLGMLTATMEATDNSFRMLQQVALHKPIAIYDWTAAGALIGAVMWQGLMHYRNEPASGRAVQSKVPNAALIGGALLLAAGLGVAAGYGGATGQAYALVTLATLGKTMAWWSNQYPQLAKLNFVQKWAVGWGIAAVFEYLAMVGGMNIASHHGVHLGLMTAYMEVLDNALRMGQQRVLGKPLAWYDYTAAVAMGAAVASQAAAHAVLDR